MYELMSLMSTKLDTLFREKLNGQLGPRKEGHKTKIAKNIFLEI